MYCKRSMKTVFGAAACSLMVGLGAASSANASVVVDFNDFAAGAPNGQFAGTGFDGAEAWQGSATVNVVAGDLNSSNYAITQSGTAQSFQGTYTAPRHTNRALDESMTGEIWFSFLAELPHSGSRAGIGFNSASSSGTDYPRAVFLLGAGTLRATTGIQGGSNTDATITATVGETALIVGKLDTDLDTLMVWFDPDLMADANIFNLTADINTDLDVEMESLDRIGILSWGSSVGGIVDNVRVSNSYQDVTGLPIPEPASLVLMGMGSLLMLRRRAS